MVYRVWCAFSESVTEKWDLEALYFNGSDVMCAGDVCSKAI